MKKSFLSKALVAVLVLLSIFAMTFVVSAEVKDTDVAKIGETGYATLKEAMDEANKAAGDYTITLLKDSAEVFTFAQKPGVNITIDGGATSRNDADSIARGAKIQDDGKTFSGKITMSKAGGGNLTFQNMKIAPADRGSKTGSIVISVTTAANITFDNCILVGASGSGNIVYTSAAVDNTVTIKNCTATALGKLVMDNQRGPKYIVIENVVATKMAYLVRALKCPNITLKNVTAEAAYVVDVKADALGCTLTLENVDLNSSYGGKVYAPISAQTGNGASYTVVLKGVNTFAANGVLYEDLSWFDGDAEIFNLDEAIEAQNGSMFGSLAAIAAAAQPGDTVTLLKDTDETLELPEGVKLDENGFEAGNVEEQGVSGKGTWGGIDWKLYDDGTLVIAPTTGTPVPDKNSGKTYEVGAWREAVQYNSKGTPVKEAGWPYDRNAVTSLIIKEGVVSIGSFCGWLPNLTGEVIIPYTVKYIGQDCFNGAPITKLTFGKVPEGKVGEELCVAQGAFKNMRIEEATLPEDRPVHIHAWVFGNNAYLKRATLPASITSVWGSNHIDYAGDFNAESNVTWDNASLIFTGCSAMETVTFGSQEVKDMFFASNRNGITSVMNGKYNGDYFVATVGLTSYTSLQAAINAAEDGATIELVKNLGNADPMKNFTENVTVDKNIIIAGKGSNPGTYTLTSPNASIQGPDGMNVEVNIEGYEVVNKNGVYALVEVIKAAELNGVAYKTLAEALAAARDGDTITLLADNAEVFAFAQNGGNITIDGNDFAFTGVITLSGEGHLTFTDMKVVAPAGQNGATIILNSKNNAPDITFYDCILTLEGVMNYTSIVYATADANNNVVFEECEASNLSYLVSTNQTGFASVTVENTVATKMASLLKCNKCTNVTIKNVTCEGNTILQVKASNKTNLHLENVKFTVTYAGYSPILMSAPDTGVSALYTIGLKGENIFVDKNGVSFTNENLVMTQDAARCIYEIVDLNPKVAQIGDKTYATLQEAIDAATAGQTITFLADITENVTINKSITIDGDNFKYTGTMNVKVVDLTITEVEFINGIVFKDKAANSGGTGGTYKFTFCNFTGENKMDYAINLYHTSTVVIEDCKMTGYAAFLQLPSSNSRLSVKNVEINAIYYGFKIDYSGSGDAVIMENVTVNAGEYALYHSNYGAKTHVIKNCTFNGGIEGIRLWDRNTGIINSFRFEGENTVSSMTNSKHVTYVLAVGATVTAPNTITATATKAGYSVKYEGGKYYTVTNFKATKTNIRFGNDLSLIFAIPQYEEFDENFYAVITYPNGDSEIVTQIVYFNNWMTDDDDLSGYYIVECSGLAAKQMTDEVSIQFFKKAGNEDDLSDDISLGDLVTTSIRDYSLSRLGKSTDEKFKTLIVDMLNYGTTAQVYFGYNTGTPANEDVDQTLASTSFTACPENHVHVQKYSDNSLVATSVRFDNSISLVFRVRVSDPSKFTPVFTYTDHMGTTHTVKARFIDAGNDETVGHTFAVELVGLVAADAHQLVTCTVYQNDADGELTNKVVAKYEDCVANYVARRIATGSTATPEAKDLYTSFMTYADAAYAYKHQN